MSQSIYEANDEQEYDEIILDKRGLPVGYKICQESIVAYRLPEDDKIGELNIVEVSDEEELNAGYWLDNIEVNKTEQKKGIGSELIRLAFKHLNLEFIPCVRAGMEKTSYRLTPDGEKLIASCVRNKIIPKPKEACQFHGEYEPCSLVVAALRAPDQKIAPKKQKLMTDFFSYLPKTASTVDQQIPSHRILKENKNDIGNIKQASSSNRPN